MFKQRTSLLFVFFILVVIFFDALQQKFYLDTFNIYPGANIELIELLQVQFIRWSVWLLFSLPSSILAWKLFTKSGEPLQIKSWGIIALTFFGVVIASIMVASALNLILNEVDLNLANFMEILVFLTFQKGMSFLFASSLLVLLIYNRSKKMVIDAQWIEIKNLKTDIDNTPSFSGHPNINIRIGNRLKLIPLNDVTWIEADDYCVKIHTSQKAYTLRKSLKSLENELAEYQFIRIHRKALLNLNYMDQVDFTSSVVKLQDFSELPLSKSGAQALRKILKATSI